jgi:hypothetical protein
LISLRQVRRGAAGTVLRVEERNYWQSTSL